MAPLLQPGDVLLLEGGIGAGKTHFARSLIQSLLLEPEDVPSPTFTLVQVYDGESCEIWHSDLYRLSDPDEAVELGLEEAFETAICLVEWPDRLADLTPQSALTLVFAVAEEGSRDLTLSWQDARWADRLKDVIGSDAQDGAA
ncbi:MAG: tRNA (adenosine(37)-N6)-threonylcarbamoyltransferase complex ATPase subunit type 1 TsaE [Pseudomonadota bacterium]|nr:tRNA (adenosine(37)-N6)-threonylcarbamoyltransferase complex ATPase subunit type 1 TsaE [Pseudomonadota bacterium]